MSENVRVAIALPGLHRVNRGAEVAFESIGCELARLDGFEVTLFGSGEEIGGRPYQFRHVSCIPREKFRRMPSIPALRSETSWEDLSFSWNLSSILKDSRFDVAITCSFPWSSWCLTKKRGSHSPKFLYVTQNGDFACFRRNSEFRWFRCDGLVCTNPDYYDTHSKNYRAWLIPNGVNPELFGPGIGDRSVFELPEKSPVVLMVSALIDSKRVLEGIKAVAALPEAVLVVAGDGPLREEVERTGRELLRDRFRRLSVPRENMPKLYRCADVFLHMSIDEPSANAYLEALSTGLPIVTHSRRVTQWTLDQYALLVDTTNLNAVSSALSEALSVKVDTESQIEYVRSRFDWALIGSQYASAIREIMRT